MEPVAKVAFFSFSDSQNASRFWTKTREVRVYIISVAPLLFVSS